MRRILIVVAAIALSTVAVKAEENVTDPKPADGQPKFDNVDWILSKAMGITKKYENVVISPTSLRVVLGLLLDAANGTTADEIAKFLQVGAEQLTDKAKIRKHYHELIKSLNRPPDSSLTSDVVTRIFADSSASLNKTYLKIVKDNYDTEVEVVDFSKLSDVITKINKWAEGATHGHIKDLLSEADTNADADMLLLNVIFFSGLWTNPFDENKTTSESFYLNDKKYITVPMMKAQYVLDYAQTYDSELQLLRMPYQGGSFAMYFILPRSRNGLDDLIENVTPAKVHSLMKTMTPTEVNVTIPRFKFSYNIGLKPVLEQFGIKSMFTWAADFSNMENSNSTGQLYVTNILQKAGIEVNEKGSTAYASTVAEIHNKFGGETTAEFKADRPFLFFIEEDKTRTVVFVGKVSDPGTNGQSPQEEKEDSFALSQSDASRSSYFDLDLLEVLGNSNKGKNIVISPASIKTNLGLLLHGSSGNTAAELRSTLHLSDNETEAEEQLLSIQRAIMLMTKQFSVKIANGLFYSLYLTYKVKKDFVDYATNNFFTYVRSMFNPDPSAVEEEINNWISGKTEGLIPSIIGPGTLQRDTSLILLNALYFKAKWLYAFPIEATRPQLFYTNGPKTNCVQMMSMRAILKYNYESDINADVLQIPFQNPTYSFAIILPRRRDGLQSLMRDLKHRSVIKLLEDQDTTEVTLSLPRFQAEFEAELTNTLKELRINQIFSDSANFSKIIGDNATMKVDTIIHRALIDVDELGATAAAATISSVIPLMTPSTGVSIVADHPFVFFVYNNEMKLILFEGVINQPQRTRDAECSTEENKRPIKPILDNIYNFDIRQQVINLSAKNNTNSTTTENTQSNPNFEPEDRFGASSSKGNQTVQPVKANNNSNNKKPDANDLQDLNPVTTQRPQSMHIQPIKKKGQVENVNFQKPPTENSQANPQPTNTNDPNQLYFPEN